MTSTITWRSTAPTKDLDFRCDVDGCDAKANTIHFVPYVDEDVEACVFGCPDHDAGGYWTELTRWFDPKEKFIDHILQKHLGHRAIGLYEQRVDQLRILNPADFRRSEGEQA